MATIYADSSLASNEVGSYSAANRDGSGSETAYVTIPDAVAAISADDDIVYIRGGTYGPYTAKIAITNAGITLEGYLSEVVNISFDNGDYYNIAVESTLYPNITIGKFNVTAGGTGAQTNTASLFRASAANIVISDVDTTGYDGVIVTGYRLATVKPIFNRCKLHGNTHDTSLRLGHLVGGTTGILEFTFNECLIIGYAIVGASNMTYNINNSNQCCTSTYAAYVYSSTGVVIYNNSNVFATGARGSVNGFTFIQTAGTLTVNGGISHGVMGVPANIKSGTVTLNSVTQDKPVKFNNLTNTPAQLTFIAVESKFGDVDHGVTPGYLDTTLTSLAANGLKACWYPDDALSPAQFRADKAFAWINAGHELGSMGYSGDEFTLPIVTEGAISITYTGANSNSIVIGNDGTTFEVTSDGGDGIAEIAIDRDSSNKFLSNLKTTVDLISGYSMAIDAGGYDDMLCEALDDGTYALTSTVAEDILFNNTRRFLLEIDYAKSVYESLVPGADIKTFLYPYFGYSASIDSKAQLQASGFVAAITERIEGNGSPAFMKHDNSDVFKLSGGYRGAKTGYTAQMDRTDEASVRKWAAQTATHLATMGAWMFFELPGAASEGLEITSNEFSWIKEEMESLGVEIVTTYEGYLNVTKGTHEIDETSLLAAESSGYGYKWWSGANPVGLDGEPFGSFDTDSGTTQSKNSPFHPTNL